MKQKQLIFIDDSGDPGFKFEKGSSRLFVIACIIFGNQYEAEFASAGIRLLKNKLGWKQYREFKFNKMNDEQRKCFFLEMKKYNFKVRATVVDKEKITEPKLRNAENFYTLIIAQTLEHFDDLKSAIVKLDGSGNRALRRRLASSLRKKVNSKNNQRITKFTLEDSQNNVLIQLADMVAGAIRLKYSQGEISKTNYLRPLLKKIEDIWLYE